MEYEVRTTAVTVAPVGAQLFSLQATTVRIEDEGGGEFLVLEQSTDEGIGVIKIDTEEWPTLRDAIDRMHTQVRGDIESAQLDALRAGLVQDEEPPV